MKEIWNRIPDFEENYEASNEIQEPRGSNKFNEKERAAVVLMKNSGATFKMLKSHFGISSTQIANILKSSKSE
ncbi:hypothetical protein [Xenorhabdus bovienii]|uniref:hypothetical protein n=1 Tax=Xenorhabdus bovienii TaxID=40576 RepID=UPI003DA39555